MNSPFPWPGGKRALKKTLLKLMPKHRIYVEVFSGSAKLLFAKEPSEWEVINDVNQDLMNFFRVAKHRPAELAELFDSEIIHSRRFRELRFQSKNVQRELEGALRFLYLAWWSFGAKGEHLATHKVSQLGHCGPTRRSLDSVREVLQNTSQRLRSVLCETRDFADCIARYDSKETFFYCDPPYTSFQPNARYESLGASRDAELAKLLRGIKGKFLLSYNDCPEIRALYRGMNLRAVKPRYTLAASGSIKARELLISNYAL